MKKQDYNRLAEDKSQLNKFKDDAIDAINESSGSFHELNVDIVDPAGEPAGSLFAGYSSIDETGALTLKDPSNEYGVEISPTGYVYCISEDGYGFTVQSSYDEVADYESDFIDYNNGREDYSITYMLNNPNYGNLSGEKFVLVGYPKDAIVDIAPASETDICVVDFSDGSYDFKLIRISDINEWLTRYEGTVLQFKFSSRTAAVRYDNLGFLDFGRYYKSAQDGNNCMLELTHHDDSYQEHIDAYIDLRNPAIACVFFDMNKDDR